MLLFAANPALHSANNGFVLMSAALVLMMTPALALFYAGFVRSRNVLNTMVMSFAAMALVSVLWVLFGYSLAFSEGSGPLAPFIGGFQWAGLSNWSASYGNGQLSPGAVALFQLTFAIITPALISGAVVERMHFRAWIAFVVLWSTFIYLPLAHMVWGPGGFLGADGLGTLDFAGGLRHPARALLHLADQGAQFFHRVVHRVSNSAGDVFGHRCLLRQITLGHCLQFVHQSQNGGLVGIVDSLGFSLQALGL